MSASDRTLFLHVGMHKTGTTTIQNFFHKNSKELLNRKIAYLAGPVANHSLLVLSLFENDPQTVHGKHVRSDSEINGISTPAARKRTAGLSKNRLSRRGGSIATRLFRAKRCIT